MLKQWEIEDSIVISRKASNKAGFGVLHPTQLIGHAARLLYLQFLITHAGIAAGIGIAFSRDYLCLSTL